MVIDNNDNIETKFDEAITILKQLESILKSNKKPNESVIKDILNKMNTYSTGNTETKSNDVQALNNNITEIEKLLNVINDEHNLNKILNIFNKYVSNNIITRTINEFNITISEELKALNVVINTENQSESDNMKNESNANSETGEKLNKEELIKQVKSMLNGNDVSPNDKTQVYQFLYTRTLKEDFCSPASIIPNTDFIDKSTLRKLILKTFSPLQEIDTRGMKEPMVNIDSSDDNKYVLIVNKFSPYMYREKFGIPDEKINYRNSQILKYFEDLANRKIYCYAGFITTVDEIKNHGIPVFNIKNLFDMYLNYQKDHYTDNVVTPVEKGPITLNSIK